MNRFAKLVHYELHRFRIIYASLLLITLLAQFVGLYLFAWTYIGWADRVMERESLSAADFAAKYGMADFSRYTNGSLWFMAPIALCAAALLLYVFLIWYRDWVGKNLFIYRLLMLPTARNYVYLAKASAILLMVLGLVAFQLFIIPVQNAAFQALVPDVFRGSAASVAVISSHTLLQILIPRTFIDFVLAYGVGITGVVVVFTAIMLERSYRLKGLIGGIAYCLAVVLVFFLPVIIAETWFSGFLYPLELFMLTGAAGILVLCASLWLSFFLLNKKATV